MHVQAGSASVIPQPASPEAFPDQPTRPMAESPVSVAAPPAVKAPRQPRVSLPALSALETTADYRWVRWCFEVVLAVSLIALAYLLWWIDGRFTISFIEMLAPKFKDWGLLQWSVPAALTIGVIAAWPRADLRQLRDKLAARYQETQSDQDLALYQKVNTEIAFRWRIVTGITIVNMGTSLPGVVLWLRGDLIPQATDWIWYIQWPVIVALASLFTFVLAFTPEKFGRWAFPQFFALLKSAAKSLWTWMRGKQRSTR